MPRPTLGAAVALALAALALGCPSKPAAPDAGTHEASAVAAPSRAGVKVPLAPGWTARIGQDESFQAGPAGRTVLRVDIRPGQAEALPTAEELVRSAEQKLQGLVVAVEHAETLPDMSLVRLRLSLQLADGGLGPESPALFGARRVGEDLFLCASLPGASNEEVLLGEQACRSIQVQPASR